MAITEQERELQQIGQINDGVKACEDAIAKAEKYERLQDNTDWKGYLSDLQGIASMHDREIQLAISMMDDAPNNTYVSLTTHKNGDITSKVVSSKSDWADYILKHKVLGEQCREWMREPERILTLSRLAREKLPILQKQLKEMSHEEAPMIGANGKS